MKKFRAVPGKILFFLLIFSIFTGCHTGNKWIGTWGCAVQLVEPHNMPPSPGLANNTLRQVVRISTGGKILRVKFSNEFGSSPLTIRGSNIALSQGNGSVDGSTIRTLKFGKSNETVIPQGKTVTSDPVKFPVKPRTDIAITTFLGETPPDVTGHPGSRTTSYLTAGNHLSDDSLPDAAKTDRWYIINSIDVRSPSKAAAVVVIGNSITDGRGSGTNKQNRWPDILSERLLNDPETRYVSVLNMGIGGNCVLRQCLGPSATDRFERDVLQQNGVRWLIILEGINDIGQAPDSTSAMNIAENLIEAYKQMTERAHSSGIKVYGATILPYKGSFYYSTFRELARLKVNEWIRNNTYFDAVIDFDKTLRNPEDTLTLLDGTHMGDFLHPNEAGYKMMGESIDLSLFVK